MSVLNKIPFINQLLNSLSEDNLKLLNSLINGSGNRTELNRTMDVPSGGKTNISVSDKGVHMCVLQIGTTLYHGYLIYSDDYCALIHYTDFQALSMLKIDVSEKTYEVVSEYLDVNELRNILSDLLISAGESGDDSNNNLINGEGTNSLKQKTIDAEEPNVASGDESVALNHETKSLQKGCTAIGGGTQAGKEGNNTNTYGFCFACGEMTVALGRGSFAEGNNTRAEGMYTHSAGYQTTARKDWQYVVGAMNWYSDENPNVPSPNLSDIDNALFIVGNGYEREVEGFEPGESFLEVNGNDAFAVYKDGHAELDSQGTTEKSVVIKSGLKSHALHIVASVDPVLNCFVTIYNADKTKINSASLLAEYLFNHEYKSSNRVLACSGQYGTFGTDYLIGLYSIDGTHIRVLYATNGSSSFFSQEVTITAIADSVSVA